MSDLWELLLFFITIMGLIGIITFQILSLMDLESDCLNPYDTASRVNRAVLPEFIVQGVLCLLFLVTGHWVMSLFCAPHLCYNIRLYIRNEHLLDVTEIFKLVTWEKTQRLIKLGYLLLLLLLSLFWSLYNALEQDERSLY